ncbi:translation initiation factor IF-6 [Archaeoglobales archaeon]|nr:MAG: translation initiation factor IF-6 [Archaeoglobales archaeon]
MAKLLSINGIPLIGLYIRSTENAAVLGLRDRKIENILKEELDVEVVQTTIAGSELVGAMAAANSNGILVSQYVRKKEIEKLSRVFEVEIVETKMTCLGNNICLNDYGAIVHPEIEKKVIERVSEFLNVKVSTGTIGGIKTVGMSAVVTNKGGLINPNSKEWEIKKINEVLRVDTITGTVNFGSDMVGTGLVANTKGYIAGRDTTGFELGVIEEALGFI